jgi:hypothetical protein
MVIQCSNPGAHDVAKYLYGPVQAVCLVRSPRGGPLIYTNSIQLCDCYGHTRCRIDKIYVVVCAVYQVTIRRSQGGIITPYIRFARNAHINCHSVVGPVTRSKRRFARPRVDLKRGSLPKSVPCASTILLHPNCVHSGQLSTATR